MYSRKKENSPYCSIHNQSICGFICCDQTCHKNGLICQDCLNLEMHKKHFSLIYPISEAMNYMRQSLFEDNLNPNIREIQDVQESFSALIAFFSENSIPQIFSLQSNLINLKERFWTSLLQTNTRNICIRIKELQKYNEEESIKNFILLLDSCSIFISEIFTTDFKWYFSQAIQLIIYQFRDVLRPFHQLVGSLNTKKLINKASNDEIYNELAKLWTTKKVMTLSHGATNELSYKYMINDLYDGQYIAYFDWKFIYIYNYITHKINFTIKTADNINGIIYLKDRSVIVSSHSGGLMGTYGINFWDTTTASNVLRAEFMRNVYNIVYIKMSRCLVYDSDDLQGSDYQIRVLDIARKMPVKSLYIPRLNIQDEIIFKYNKQKNLLIIKITPDENIRSDDYNCLFLTYECRNFTKVASFPFVVDKYLGLGKSRRISSKKWKLKHNMMTNFKSFIINYTPGTVNSIEVDEVELSYESDKIGTISHSNNAETALISLRRTKGLDNVYSILFYDVNQNKVIAETYSISKGLPLNVVYLQKEEVIIVASYDSSISFLNKDV